MIRTAIVIVAGVVVLLAGCGQRDVGPIPVAPFDAETAEQHQLSSARNLDVPVEITNSIGMKLILIPAGEFMMGSPQTEEDRSDNEYQHRVRITKPFYLGVYEVTQAEYERVMGTNPSWCSPTGRGGRNAAGLDTSQFRVEHVSWNSAKEFCRELSSLPDENAEQRVYRLPTEAEWEYACRAGTTTPFHFGSQLNGRMANCEGDSPYGTDIKGVNFVRPTTVGSYPPNAFGLYDMHGNAWEWCEDWYDGFYYRESPVDDPPGAYHGAYSRVYRGGGAGSWAELCRAATRGHASPGHAKGILGLRVALDPPGG